MLLRQIKYFQTVVEKGSFTEAAEACYISQSAISQQIQSLEKEIGVTTLTLNPVVKDGKWYLTIRDKHAEGVKDVYKDE